MALNMESLLDLIEKTGQNPSAVVLAKYLDVSRQTIYKRAKAYSIDLHVPLTREAIRQLGTALPINGLRKSAVDHVRDQRDAALQRVAALEKAQAIERQRAAKNYQEVLGAYQKITRDQDAVISAQRQQLDATQAALAQNTAALSALTSIQVAEHNATTASAKASRKFSRAISR
jgi:DNA-binding XRE family transcriptional regulator